MTSVAHSSRAMEMQGIMVNSMDNLNAITEKIIGCAIEVHKILGPGLLETLYEKALRHEFAEHKIKYENQVSIPVIYKGVSIGEHRIDLLVENDVIIELKAANKNDPIYKAQLLSYLKISGKRIGLLINFNVTFIRNGITRIIL